MSFKYSIDKTGRELLFLPVPLQVKKRVKIFIDVIVDRWFRGLAGGLLLLCIYVADFDLPQISIIVILLLGIWLFLVFLLKKEYVNSFRKALEKRQIDMSELTINIDDHIVIKSLLDALNSNNERQVAYSLDILRSVKDIDLLSPLKPLLEHSSNEIRLKSIQVLKEQADIGYVPEIEKMIDDSDPGIQVEALHYLYINTAADKSQFIQNNLKNQNPRIAAATAFCIAEYGAESEKELLDASVIETLLEVEDGDRDVCRIHIAEALGSLNKSSYRNVLLELMNDSSDKVRKAAIAAAGRTGDREFVQPLINLLSDVQFRKEARDALAAYGSSVLGTLGDYMTDTTVDILIRRNIPKVMSKIPSQDTVGVLTAGINSVEPSLKYYLVKALNKLRVNYPELKFDQEKVESVLIDQTQSYYEILNIIEMHKDNHQNDASGLLEKALHEKLDLNLEKIFRLLGLRYPPDDIYSAYLGLSSKEKSIRASAVEFLDNVLAKNLKKYLIPIIDFDSSESLYLKGKKLFDLKIDNVDQALEILINGKDSWLKACAIFNITKESSENLRKLVENARMDKDRIVCETAELVFKRELT